MKRFIQSLFAAKGPASATRKTQAFRPGFEALEDREVPACLVGFDAMTGTLKITGDAANDVVIMNDNGAGVVTGNATGWGAYGFAGVKNIVVNTEGGNDLVGYRLTSNLLAHQQRVLTVGLGYGDDKFIANLYNPAAASGSDLQAYSSLIMGIGGGNGNDDIRVNADKDVDVAVGARLKVIMAGHDGNDLLAMNWKGENDGAVALREADGGRGDDKIRATLFEDFGSTGKIAGQMHGSDGNDALALLITTSNVPVLALLDGGAGIDNGVASANVTVVNVP